MHTPILHGKSQTSLFWALLMSGVISTGCGTPACDGGASLRTSPRTDSHPFMANIGLDKYLLKALVR